LVRPCTDADFDAVLSIVNDGAEAYRGIIPEDRCAEAGGSLVGVMGVQPVDDVILIRHAYVQTSRQHRGVGSELLTQLIAHAPCPVLIGTWKAARRAVRFYEKHDFRLVEGDEKNRLLRHYWDIPDRQVETSVVMADPRALCEIVKTPLPPREDGDDGIDIFNL
jgi:N-acetylglutamate synthase-like GNAT family acetyltransferase